MTELNVCDDLHKFAQALRKFHFGEDADNLPKDGVYFIFERGQEGHGGPRIVRIGSHTGNGKLAARLREHITQNKDRSIFRKNIGRALLNSKQDPFLEDWNVDLTTRKNKDLYAHRISKSKLAVVEDAVTDFIVKNLHFSVIGCPSSEAALRLEALCIGTISTCKNCGPTSNWLGHSSPKVKISRSGLWQEVGLFRTGLTQTDLRSLMK